MEVVGFEEPPLSWIRQHTVGEELLEDLSVVDLLFDGTRGQQTIDGHLPCLTNTPRPLSSLEKIRPKFNNICMYILLHVKSQSDSTPRTVIYSIL